MSRIPVGVLVDLLHFQRTCPAEWAPLPEGAAFVGHRREGREWVLAWGLPGGTYIERRVPRWDADWRKRLELDAEARRKRADFHVVR